MMQMGQLIFLMRRNDIIYAENDYAMGQGAPVRPSETVLPQNKERTLKDL